MNCGQRDAIIQHTYHQTYRFLHDERNSFNDPTTRYRMDQYPTEGGRGNKKCFVEAKIVLTYHETWEREPYCKKILDVKFFSVCVTAEFGAPDFKSNIPSIIRIAIIKPKHTNTHKRF
ncbi:hypothetical protein CEXT_626691 [Caerostris extrusa]|uniref:Uncharacterized protein n=1 Tax=Caerostris extrusa TaxID=172846 RepID=A0AAV4TH31_CAEEX|nr:hypothetical protein CEXT_626691 [Caerostris extrusa]